MSSILYVYCIHHNVYKPNKTNFSKYIYGPWAMTSYLELIYKIILI